MSYIIHHISKSFKSMEELADSLLNLFAHTIHYEFEHYEKIKWFSIGYEQRFSVAVGDEEDESRRTLISSLGEGKHYDLLGKIETGLTDAPLFNALLSTIVVRLGKKIKEGFADKLERDFQMFVFTDDEWFHDPEIQVQDFNRYETEEKEELCKWIESFCSTEKLREYLLNMVNHSYQGQDINQLAKQYWAN